MKGIRSEQSNHVLKGAVMLTGAALVTKVLSAFYRIPFQNLVGDVGFYIYQQVYPFYGIALVLSTYGFPVILSKLYIEKVTLNGKEGASQLIWMSLATLMLLGSGLFILLYVGAPFIAEAMDDDQLVVLLRTISFTFLLFPVLSVLRGYFQGQGDMRPTAISQVGEQLLRVMTILVIAFLWKHKDLYIVGAGAMSGAVVGGITSIAILSVFLIRKSKKKLTPTFGSWTSFGSVAKNLLVNGVAISISSMLLLFIQLADSLNLYSLLLKQVESAQLAKEWKGVYDRGVPLIQLGTVVATSMSLALVPLISSERLKRQVNQLQDKIRIAILVSLSIGAAASTGLIAIIEPTNIMLFEDTLGSNILALQSSVILLSSLVITMLSILQGLGFMSFSAWYVLLAASVKYIGNLVLVPSLGTAGAALATILSLSLLAICLFLKVAKTVPGPILKGNELAKVGLAALFMYVGLQLYSFLLDGVLMESSRTGAAVEAVVGVMVGGFIYIISLLRMRVFKEQELLLLPFGSKLVKILPNHKKDE